MRRPPNSPHRPKRPEAGAFPESDQQTIDGSPPDRLVGGATAVSLAGGNPEPTRTEVLAGYSRGAAQARSMQGRGKHE